MDNTVSDIKTFQRKIEKYSQNRDKDKLVYYLSKLKHLAITVRHLELTGVGKSVNSLRHIEGQVGEKAKKLVNMWMSLVTAEESNKGTANNNSNNGCAKDGDSCDEDEDAAAATIASPRTSKQQPPPQRLQPQDYEEDDDDDEDDGERLQIQEEDNEVLESDEQESPVHNMSVDSNSYVPANSTQDYSRLVHCNNSSPGTYSASDKYTGNSAKYGQPTSCSDSEQTQKYDPTTSTTDYQSVSNSDIREPVEYQPTVIQSSSPVLNGEEEMEISSSHRSKHLSEHKSSKSKHRDKSRDKKHKSHSKDKDSKEKDSKDKSKHKSSDKEKERSQHKDKRKDKERSNGKKHRDHSDKEQTKDQESVDRLSKSHKENNVINSYNLSPEGSHSSESGSISLVNGYDLPDIELSNAEKAEDPEPSTNKHKSNDKHRLSKSSSKSKDKDKKDDKSKKDKKDKKKDREEQSSKDHKSKKRKNDEGGFGAALMNNEVSSKKKKTNHKSKEDKNAKSRSSSSNSSHNISSGSGGSSKKGNKSHSGNNDSKVVEKCKASTSKDVSNSEMPPPPLAAVTSPSLQESFSKIDPNYKPLPRPPIVIDDEILDEDFDNYPQVEQEVGKPELLTQEETLSRMLNKKVKRTAIYSGKLNSSVSKYVEVPSLFNMVVDWLGENVQMLEYTGGIPFEILKPVIERITPRQLFNLENFNHYLLEDTQYLWERHAKADFKTVKPDEMETYRDMYMRLIDKQTESRKKMDEKWKTFNTRGGFSVKPPEKRRMTQLAFVGTVAKPPNSVARAQAKYGTGVPVGTPARTTKAAELQARKQAMHNINRVERSSAGGAGALGRGSAASKKPKAPLMAKTMQFYKKAYRR